MSLHGLLSSLPNEIRLLITLFVLTLNIGFFTGLSFVNETTSFKTNGIETQYLGNENDEDAEVMQFKKSKKEVLTLIHNHILSMSIIFLLLGGLLSLTSINKKIKKILMIEPFVSIILTFGGIYILWNGVLWFKYIIIVSGIAMTLSFILSSFFILKESVFKVVGGDSFHD
ncbi:MAG: hypothetical protein ABFR05_10375 [Bacteroidota bacterium]